MKYADWIKAEDPMKMERKFLYYKNQQIKTGGDEIKMLKKMKTMISLSVIICIGLFGAVTVGCNDDEEEQYTYEPPKNCDVVLEQTGNKWTNELTDFIAVCKSPSELKNVCLSNGYDFLSFLEDIKEDIDERNADKDNKVREYYTTDEYFEEKSLVVCAFVDNGYSGQYRIKEVEVNARKLTLYIKSPVSDMVFDVMNSVMFVAGVDKTFLANVTELTYEIC